MNIVLTGFMGTGKTTVGRQVAEILHIPFYDVDKLIVQQEGKSISVIFAENGEDAFRAIEKDVIRQLCEKEDVLIAAGGGALLDMENRMLLKQKGILVCLRAKAGTLLERLKDDLTRPLLAGENPEQKMERLLKERETIYAECPIQISTDGKTIAEVAGEVVEKILPQWFPPKKI